MLSLSVCIELQVVYSKPAIHVHELSFIPHAIEHGGTRGLGLTLVFPFYIVS